MQTLNSGGLRTSALLCLVLGLMSACEGTESPPAEMETDSGSVVSDGGVVDGATSRPDRGQALIDAEVDAMVPETDMMLPDTDGDGVPDRDDVFPMDPDESADRDGDGVGDNADEFPADPDESTDGDGDGVGDNGDAFPEDPNDWSDRDGDGIGDNFDVFPNNPDESSDNDNDGLGDNEDLDDDNDGLSDEEERSFGEDCARSSAISPDSDGDGIDDRLDPYPLDPHAEFLVRRGSAGRIDLFLSNRDGTFGDLVEIGDAIEHEGNPLRYEFFSVGDFDGNGVMDFIAQSSPLVEGQPERNVYFFVRDAKADEFTQHLIGTLDARIYGVVADVNGDYAFDIITVEIDRPNNVTGARVVSYINNQQPDPNCVAGETAEAGCFFIKLPVQDISPTVAGQWVVRSAFQAVNLNPEEDVFPDLTVVTYATGGNSPSDVYTLNGLGDGRFSEPILRFTHNAQRQHAPANTVLFADFDNDGVGDVVMGFDDDGRAGEAWTYFGMGDGNFFQDPLVALDLNPRDEREAAGGRNEYLGREGSGRTFDFDFDGNADLIVGYHHETYRTAGQTRLYRGNGNGSFSPEFTIIGPASMASGNFAIPQRLCPRFAFVRN